MKKLALISALIVTLFASTVAFAASWTEQIQAAIKNGKFDQIDVIAAKNPEDQGDIAMYLLQQSQNTGLSQDVRIKIFTSAAPFGSQIPQEDSTQAASLISDMLNLSGDPAFQQSHHQQAVAIISTALGLSDQPNILTGNPNVHEVALAQANEFINDGDQGLQDQVDLALQVGLSPPVGPRGIINPSAE